MARSSAVLAASVAIAALTSPAGAGPPYLTDDPEPPPFGHYEAVFFTMGLEANGIANGALPAMEFNYGGFPDTQLHVMLPVGFASGDERTRFGAADAELGVKYRFVDEDEQGWRPQVATYPQVEIPLGPASNGFANRSVDVFLPLWAQKDVDANWTIGAGGGIWVNPGEKNYGFAGLLLQRKLSDALIAGAEVFHQTPNVEGGAALTGFNVGAVYDFDEHHHLLVSAGRGLQNVTATDQFTWYLGFEFTN
ncbi:MAG TPA: hypothetical protein VHT03_04225 [Rhizomicrobium sp.]|jgi:hypothetical protein|nr:hypothetical protein [Rhizomicrobium sp.]